MAKCRECGIEIPAGGKQKFFCTVKHRKMWNNRRAVRGAELYDLFMALRFDREDANKAQLWTVISNLARAYRDADKARRDGRKSWNWREAIARRPLVFGSDGDKR